MPGTYYRELFDEVAGARLSRICGAQAAFAPPPAPPVPASDGCADGLPVSVGLPGERPCVKPGSVQAFKDCPGCPEMVVVPAGSFTMGSPEDEPPWRANDEGPRRKVTIAKPFAVGRFAVTFADWDACANDGGCGCKPDDRGWSRGDRPVINVSWDDAKAYVAWLSKKTGKSWRSGNSRPAEPAFYLYAWFTSP